MSEALIAVLGILLGIGVSELIRRRNRVENYSTHIFERRLKVHEELFDKVGRCDEIASVVIESDELSKEQRHEIVSNAVMEIAQFSDENESLLSDTFHNKFSWLGSVA